MYNTSEKHRVTRAQGEGAQQNGSKCVSTQPPAAASAFQELGMSAGGDEEEVLQTKRAPKTSFWRTGWGDEEGGKSYLTETPKSLGTESPATESADWEFPSYFSYEIE